MFRTRIRELRELSGFSSQQSFADAFGVAQSTVGNWEAGKREPNYETTMKLADFFQVSVDYLLGRDDMKQTIRTHEPISILFSMYSITVDQFSKISGINSDLVDRLSVLTDTLSSDIGETRRKQNDRLKLYSLISDEQYKKIYEFFLVDLTKRDESGKCELPLFPNKKVVAKIRKLVERMSPSDDITAKLAELDARIAAIEDNKTREDIARMEAAAELSASPSVYAGISNPAEHGI